MKRVSLLLALCLSFNAAWAAEAGHGDAAQGKAKAAACGACHGADGNSANPEWPSLAGQHASYLVGQLKAFKSQARKNPIMMGQVANLSEADMRDIAAYYAAQTPKPGVSNPDAVAVAEAIYRGGKPDAGVPACLACHGPSGDGNAAAAYPRINAQQGAYTVAALKAYRSGERAGTDAARMMSNVAGGLSDADIDALASYLQGLH